MVDSEPVTSLTGATNKVDPSFLPPNVYNTALPVESKSFLFPPNYQMTKKVKSFFLIIIYIYIKIINTAFFYLCKVTFIDVNTRENIYLIFLKNYIIEYIIYV